MQNVEFLKNRTKPNQIKQKKNIKTMACIKASNNRRNEDINEHTEIQSQVLGTQTN